MASWWVKISQSYTVDLPKDRPFTRLEAAFSLAVDQFNDKAFSLRGYSRLWQWSTTKVAKFMEDLEAEYVADFAIKNTQKKVTAKKQESNSEITPKEQENSMLQPLKKQESNEIKTEKKRTIKREDKEDTFVQFWNLYPRKTNKAEALKIWSRLNPSPETLSVIMTALDSQCKQPDWKKNGGQFVPHPSTWLNKRRWEDEFTAQASPATNANMQLSRREELRAQGLDV